MPQLKTEGDSGLCPDFSRKINSYTSQMHAVMEAFDWAPVHALAQEFLDCWKTGRQIFVCGNGGSGANAVHIANDFIYGISKKKGSGLRCHALSANAAVLTCLANDEGYDQIFSYQLGVQAQAGDVLLVLSGSGNSGNIVEAIKTADDKGMQTYGVLGYSGGKAKELLQVPIHFEIDDMQISEDLQMVVAHMISQWLYDLRDSI